MMWDPLRRLFSTFASGWPGAGLLLMRLVGGAGLLYRGITGLWGSPPLGRTVLELLVAGAGMFLLAGLWTPIVGSLVALVELWNCFSLAGDPWPHLLLGALGAALAMLGPGAWSADARLFGWRRIVIPDRKS